jgi:hypothetical protein
MEEVERSGSRAVLEKATGRLKDSGKAQKVLQVPQHGIGQCDEGKGRQRHGEEFVWQQAAFGQTQEVTVMLAVPSPGATKSIRGRRRNVLRSSGFPFASRESRLRPDPQSFAAHMLIDFSGLCANRVKAAGKKLKARAVARDWLYKA